MFILKFQAILKSQVIGFSGDSMKKFLNLNTVYLLAAMIALSAMLLPRAIDLIQLWNQGISYVAKDFDNFYHTAIPIEESYKVEIDLDDLESNAGKIVYDDGDNQISVSKVVSTKEGDWDVIFRSSGTYDLGGATLVTGIKYTRKNEGYANHLKAEETYRGHSFKLTPVNYSALKYMDGDEFSFKISPANLAEERIIDVTLSDLYVNLWLKKSIFN